MNLFDIKSALLAKHAQHVVLVHFPIALFLTGVAFDFAARGTKRATLAAAAYANLLAAALSVPPVVATGLMAWQWQLDGQRLRGILLLHLVLGGISGVLICIVAGLHIRARRDPRSSLPTYCFLLEIGTAMLVALTGHLGGFLSGVNIPG
jgi:uncharacterized membrane protein